MRTLAVRLSGFIGRHSWAIVAVWALIVVVSLPFAMRQTEHLTGGGFESPGSQSDVVQEALASSFPDLVSEGTIGVVVEADPGLSAGEIDAAVAGIGEQIRSIEGLSVLDTALAVAADRIKLHSVSVIPVNGPVSGSEQIDAASDLRAELDPGTEQDGITTYLTGQPAAWAGLQELSKEDLASAEVAGFPIVALILIVVFGSLAAAALPLALGFAAVVVTGAVIYVLSLHMGMSVFVTNMASMIGIGVAVDYSLFVLARYREEVARGRDRDEARAAALSTSGLSVTFSGLAVIVSVSGIWVIDNQALRSMALGAVIVVAVAITAAVVLLPAIINLLGDRVVRPGRVHAWLRPGRGSDPADPERPGFWERWTARVMRRPWLSIAFSVSILLLLASPLLALKTGSGALAQFPSDHDVVQGAKLQRQMTGGGADPIFIEASFDGPDNAEDVHPRLNLLASLFQANPNLAAVSNWRISEDGSSAVVAVVPLGAADEDQTIATVEHLREDVVPGSELAATPGITIAVGGEAARIVDVRNLVTGSMWKIVAFILALSFVVLMLMLRSLVLPLKAIAMNLLSIGAAFGVLVMIFQWGWIDGFLGFRSIGALDTINLPLILAVVFGLSMDYEVFLLSRIRERYRAHGDNRRAVAEGLATSAPTISSAALIMACVFAVFAFTGVPTIKEIGVGCAVAITLDATLVRLILVPAAMQLLGDWNWWLPGWLDRLLPRTGFDAEPEVGDGEAVEGAPGT